MKFGKHELTTRNRPLEKWHFREVNVIGSLYKNNNNNSAICQGGFVFQELEKGGREVVDVKERMADLGMTQVDMILELQKRGYAVQPPMLSSILRGVYTYPKAKKILAVCEEILKERENE